LAGLVLYDKFKMYLQKQPQHSRQIMSSGLFAHATLLASFIASTLLGIQAAQRSCKQDNWEPCFRRTEWLLVCIILAFVECFKSWDAKSYILIATLPAMILSPCTYYMGYHVPYIYSIECRAWMMLAVLFHTAFYTFFFFFLYESFVFIVRWMRRNSPLVR
jgi:hypothetical protein